MFQKLVFPFVATLALAAAPAVAEIKFIRPGEPPPGKAAEPDIGGLKLDEIYRGIDLLNRFNARMSRGLFIGVLINDFARDDIDGKPGITDSDRELAARIEISQARSRSAQPWAAKDLDGDGMVTRTELMAVGRIKIGDSAQRQQAGAVVELTDAQREALALDYVEKFLVQDLNGDDAVSYEEATASVDAEGILTRFRTNGGALKPVWDADSNGTITEAEVRRAADRLLDLVDANGNNMVDANEAQEFRKALLRAQARAGDPSRGKRIKCTLPEVPRAVDVIVLQGEAGTAVTNIAFDVPNDPVVRMTEVVVPEGDGEIYLIASMRKPTVLRLTGPGAGRVKAVVGVAAIVGLAGGDASLANTPCQRGFLGIKIKEPGGVAAEFGRALGRDDIRVVVAERLGRVDLGSLTNSPDTRLEDDATPVMAGDGQFVIDRFLSKDPGGYQALDAGQVQATVPVRKRDVPPLEMGLIVLASEGKIDFVEPPPGFLSREVPEGIKRAVPDGSSTDGIVWQQQPGGGSKATFPLTVVVRRAIELPAGLTTERGVRLIVPDGVPKPRGAVDWAPPN